MWPGRMKSIDTLVLLYSCLHAQTAVLLSPCCDRERYVSDAHGLSSRKGTGLRSQPQGCPVPTPSAVTGTLAMPATPCHMGTRAHLEQLQASERPGCLVIWRFLKEMKKLAEVVRCGCEAPSLVQISFAREMSTRARKQS